ncbi:MAG: hypothetical protein OXP12_07775 [Thaumarchaeota archaeon]|nr:hypothetical protein [Nitrososphaerota archaeon]MDE0266417.1 hypothetical protein [Nitrososphaerota archaeon]MDE0525362.1 hypothetical protein [Nitrososphaerota archaeon]
MILFLYMDNKTDAQAALIAVQAVEIKSLQEQVDALEDKAGKQAQRLKTLERQMAILTAPPATNMPNLP